MKTVIENGVIPTICRQCDMKCGINVHVSSGVITRITGQKKHPQNSGYICPKARIIPQFFYHKDRIKVPLKRMKDGTFREISYQQAVKEITDQIRKIIQKYGPPSIGVWKGEATGFAQQEEYARRFIHSLGSPNYLPVDSQCYSSRYIAHKLVQGYYNYPPDFANSSVILVWGSNIPISHTVYLKAIKKAKEKGAKLVVIDPRITEMSRMADIYLQITPGTDGALALGLAHYLIINDSYDHEFVFNYSKGFEEFSAYVKDFTPEIVENITGIDNSVINSIGRLLASGKPKITNFVGVSLEHQDNGVNSIRAIAALNGLCGSIDTIGGDIWPESPETRSLTLYDEIPLTDLKPIGYDRFPIPYLLRHDCHTMTAVDYMLGKGDYPLTALILTAGNPVNTNANTHKVVEGFKKLELLVVHDLFLTETARLAHYIIPAATFLERSEIYYYPHLQRIALSQKVLSVNGAIDEYSFFHDLAHSLGFGKKYFPWHNEEEVNRWILEPTSITVKNLLRHPEGIEYKEFHYKKYKSMGLPTPSGKFEFTSSFLSQYGYPQLPVWEKPWYMKKQDKEYPYILITGVRNMIFYHSRYHNIESFSRKMPYPPVEINRNDAKNLGINEEDHIRLTSKIGSVEVIVKIVGEKELFPGVLRMPNGWEGQYNPNRLTFDEINDPISGYPLLKSVPVKVISL